MLSLFTAYLLVITVRLAITINSSPSVYWPSQPTTWLVINTNNDFLIPALAGLGPGLGNQNISHQLVGTQQAPFVMACRAGQGIFIGFRKTLVLNCSQGET